MVMVWVGALSVSEAADPHHPIFVSAPIAALTSRPCSPIKTELPEEIIVGSAAAFTGIRTRTRESRRNAVIFEVLAAICNHIDCSYLKFSRIPGIYKKIMARSWIFMCQGKT
jgi:hypothetical protein